MTQSSLPAASTTAAAPPAFVPEYAPFVLLAFLGAGFLLFCGVVGGGIALAARRARLARVLGGCAALVASGYAALLLGAALVSRDRTLEPGERKYFCEMDCHLAYSVAAASADGRLRTVAVRTWFDPDTISSFRGNGPLTPNPRVVYLVDESGRRIEPSPLPATAALGDSTPLTRELRPGESYTTTFVFEVPPGFSRARLFLGDAAGAENLLIGHENSPLHGKVYFRLDSGRATSGS